MNEAEIVSVVTQFSSIGFAVWYAWWTTTHTIPNMQNRHDELVGKIIAEFRMDIKEQRADFINQLAVINSTSDRMCDAITELHKSISDFHAKNV